MNWVVLQGALGVSPPQKASHSLSAQPLAALSPSSETFNVSTIPPSYEQVMLNMQGGDLIISAARNTKSTIFVWKWREQKLLYRCNTKAGVPPQVYGVKWNRVEKADGSKVFHFASFGNKHINFWKKDLVNREPKKFPESWSFEPGSFINKQDPAPAKGGGLFVQDVMCVEFLNNGNIVGKGIQSQ